MQVWAVTEPLQGWTGERLAVGFDFASVPLADDESLTERMGDSALSVSVVTRAGVPRPEAVIGNPVISGTQVTARIQPAADDAYLQILVPTTAGNIVGARRFLEWY